MIRNRSFTHLFSASALCLTACASAGGEDDEKVLEPRDEALQILRDQAGAEVTLDINELGTTRVVAMSPQFPVATFASGPAAAASEFLSANHDVFGLDPSDASNFLMTGMDVDTTRGMSHITLQRVFSGIPVFQGSITVHMNAENQVFHAVGDEFYRVDAPSNRFGLTPADAAQAAATAFGVPVALTQVSAEGLTTTFTSDNLADPLRVDQRIYQVAPGDNRYAYQVLLAWFNEQKEQQYWLSMIDGADGKLLYKYNLVNTFTCRVFSVNSQPTATEAGDRRVVESCDGNATASPNGWVGAARTTVGNNAEACTDLNANNSCAGGNETQPVANASDSFDFPFNASQDAAQFRAASVTNVFFLSNDFHDRMYALGFNEASRNFQTNNFGRGGVGNDPVNLDAMDGSGTNNANFGTPPDGSRPRMQMFLFSLARGTAVRQDSDFDPTVVYHEYSHGLSNRLIGNAGGCLGGLQSGGMGEGWGDFMGASILGVPVVGAYVTGNAVRGIRSNPMNNTPHTYDSVRNGTLTGVHAVGEAWAAALWAARTRVGRAVIEQLVVSGMKLTPCQPTFVQARDAIIQADANINGGANRCALWEAFASRQMGTGASSPNHNSTSAIVVSTAVPADCGGGGGGQTVFTDDFEVERGWTVNPLGTDTAATGQWQRGNPAGTTSGGVTTQQNTTPSGVNALVTAAAAGAAAGTNDVDGGVTTIQSPAIAIPAGGTVTLSMSFYMAHLNNSGADDFFRVFIVNAAGTATQVFQEVGAANSDAATYAAQSVNISQFAGQTVRVRFQAADAGTASLVEASVDNVTITRQQ